MNLRCFLCTGFTARPDRPYGYSPKVPHFRIELKGFLSEGRGYGPPRIHSGLMGIKNIQFRNNNSFPLLKLLSFIKNGNRFFSSAPIKDFILLSHYILLCSPTIFIIILFGGYGESGSIIFACSEHKIISGCGKIGAY